MSTWTSRVAVLGFAGLWPVAGCIGPTLGSAPMQMAVAEGSVVIAGPTGYCVDTRGRHDSSRGTFVLMGSCQSLSGQLQAPHPQTRAVLTAAVSTGAGGAGIDDAGTQLTAYFRSQIGRAALSHSGRAKTVSILSTRSADGVFFIHLTDSALFPLAAKPAQTWRGLFDLNGRIVTLSVIALPDQPISDAEAMALLKQFMAAVKVATPAAHRLRSTAAQT